MVSIKINFTWKQWVAVLGSLIIFSAVAYCIITTPEKTVEKAGSFFEKITEKSIEIK
jgi:hypothetical protein